MMELTELQFASEGNKLSDSKSLNRFVPEVFLRNADACEALRHLKQRPAAVMFNYRDLKMIGYPKNKSDYVEQLLIDAGRPSVILNSVCPDSLVDDFDVNYYLNMALALKAKFVLSPDDYIYLVDDDDRTFQNASMRRALYRTRELIHLSQSRFEVVGLVIGRSQFMRQFFCSRLQDIGINKFAFPCGDLMKAGDGDSHKPMYEFVDMCKAENANYILVGLHSPKHLKSLIPMHYSSPIWSIEASHSRTYNENYKKSLKPNGISCKNCASSLKDKSHLALHNIYSDFTFAQRLGSGESDGWTY